MEQKRIEMDDATKEALQSKDVVPPEICVRNRKYYPKEPEGHGHKGVVWKGLDEYNGPIAIKFTIYEDYIEKSYLEEASRARLLRGKGSFAGFIDAGIVKLTLLDGKEQRFICFIEEWVDGWTLPKYLDHFGASASFLINYVRGMCEALSILKAVKLRHDDLRQANVMLEKPGAGEIVSNEVKVKIIDTGSLKSSEVPSQKKKDDHRWFAEHLIDIRNSLRKTKSLSLMRYDPLWMLC